MEIIIILLAITVVAAFVAETVNPFIIVKQIARWIGIGVGYTPKAFEATREIAKELKMEADLELKSTGKETELKYSQGRELGKRYSERVYNPVIAKAKERQAEIEESLKAFK